MKVHTHVKCVSSCSISNILHTVGVLQTFSSLTNTSNIKTIKSESILPTVKFKISLQAVLVGKCTDDVCNTSAVQLHLQCIFNVKGDIFVLITQEVCNCPAAVWWLVAGGC